MKYLPILDELFSSDSIIFMLIGLAFAVFIAVKMKDTKKNLIGIIVSLIGKGVGYGYISEFDGG